MSTLVLGVFGTEDNGTVMVRRDGQTIRLPLPRSMRGIVEQSIGGMLPENVAQSLLGQQALAPRSINYDNTATFPDGGRGSAYDPATGSFPPTPAGAAGPATVPSTVSEQLLAGADPGVPEVATRESTASEQLMAPAGLASSPFPRRRPEGLQTASAGDSWMPESFMESLRRSGQAEFLPDIQSALEEASAASGVSPLALAAMINTESRFDPRALNPRGNFAGATQMGPAVFRDAGGSLGGVTYEQYAALPLADQIRLYPRYLEHYGRLDLVRELAAGQDPAMQAAILQGFQFAPNDPIARSDDASFVAGMRAGDLSRRTTPYPQAAFLGDTSLNAMRDHYATLLGGAAPPPSTPEQPTRAAETPASAPAAPRAPASDRRQSNAAPPERMMPSLSPGERLMQGVQEIPERVAGFVSNIPERVSNFVDTLPERISDFAANPGEALAGLDDLPDALQFLELMDNTPQMRVPAPPPIIRPRGGSGSQAIQRMGLRSLA